MLRLPGPPGTPRITISLNALPFFVPERNFEEPGAPCSDYPGGGALTTFFFSSFDSFSTFLAAPGGFSGGPGACRGFRAPSYLVVSKSLGHFG